MLLAQARPTMINHHTSNFTILMGGGGGGGGVVFSAETNVHIQIGAHLQCTICSYNCRLSVATVHS